MGRLPGWGGDLSRGLRALRGLGRGFTAPCSSRSSCCFRCRYSCLISSRRIFSSSLRTRSSSAFSLQRKGRSVGAQDAVDMVSNTQIEYNAKTSSVGFCLSGGRGGGRSGPSELSPLCFNMQPTLQVRRFKDSQPTGWLTNGPQYVSEGTGGFTPTFLSAYRGLPVQLGLFTARCKRK